MKHILRTLCLAVTLCATAPTTATAQKESHHFDVARSLDIFNALYRDLDLYYVDTLDARRHVGDAIDYMLEQLDPYTEFYREEDTGELKQLATGKYAGIGSGVRYKRSEDRCVISSPFEGMPAARAGLRTGDVILAIGGRTVPPCGIQDSAAYTTSISQQLRGEPGTTFELQVRRPATGRTYTFTLTRNNILTPSVSLTTMVRDSVGYIRIAQFIEGTSNEVRRATGELKQKGARRLVLDLRGNPGGLIDEAVKTVNLFIPRGREVVSTRGKVKEANRTYRTPLDPLDPDIPIAVLTDFGSASSSEIVSGALQDYDRALIVGQRTYGKGLVQQSRELPYKAMLKLTTGKYYIPSGRCVQAYSFKNGEPVHLPDSLAKEYLTANGRIVKGGGGITPDLVVKADSLPNLIYYVSASEQLFDYCVTYRNTHDSIAPPEQFRLSEKEYADFCDFMTRQGFEYDRQSLQALRTLRAVAKLEGYDTEAKDELDALEAKLRHDAGHDFRRWEKEIRRVVEAAIVGNYYYARGAEEYYLPNDPELEAALKVLCDDEAYHKTLSGEPEP